jgi:hypothetical protein
MASGASASRPLLQDFDIDSTLAKKVPQTSLRSLEDGDDSLFDSEDEELRPRPGFLRRLRMAVRRRNGLRGNNGPASVKLAVDEKKRRNSFRLRKRHAAKACVVIPLLVVIFL